MLYANFITIVTAALFGVALARGREDKKNAHNVKTDVTVHKVTVGADGQKVFCPDVIHAAIGDIVEFEITPPHAVQISDWYTPCQPHGPGSDDTLFWNYTVTQTHPTWIYCPLPGACAAGMDAVINGDAGGLEEWKEKAAVSGH